MQQHLSSIDKQRFIFVKSDYRLVRVVLDDILYIEGLKDYVRIILASGERITSLINMKRLEELLPYPEFMRTHRSYIAHMTNVTAVDKQRLVFDKDVIPHLRQQQRRGYAVPRTVHTGLMNVFAELFPF